MRLDRSLLRRLLLPVCALAVACGEADRPVAPSPAREEAGLAIDREEAARLRALGYGELADPSGGDRSGVVLLEADAVQPGWSFFANVRGCSAHLMALDGTVLRFWRHEPCGMWGNAVLLENGDVLVVHRKPRRGKQQSKDRRELLRLDWNGSLLWAAQLPVHHDVEVTPDGRIATLTYQHRIVPEIDASVPVRDHAIALLTQGGELVEEYSLLALLRTAPEPFRLKPIDAHYSTPDQMQEIDLIHSNAIEWMRRPDLAERDPLYAPSNVLLSLRTQDAVVVVDWERKRVVWSWGQDEMSGPHDATVLDDGHFLVFDNGLGRGWSRVIELDPIAREIVWEYRAPEGFFTATRGAAQRLANGNTLITDSEAGRAFEVTPDHRIVWDFWNPDEDADGERSIIVRMRRLPEPPAPEGPFAKSD
jgi:hypothetical protein